VNFLFEYLQIDQLFILDELCGIEQLELENHISEDLLHFLQLVSMVVIFSVLLDLCIVMIHQVKVVVLNVLYEHFLHDELMLEQVELVQNVQIEISLISNSHIKISMEKLLIEQYLLKMLLGILQNEKIDQIVVNGSVIQKYD
jgi:hypothetical protein